MLGKKTDYTEAEIQKIIDTVSKMDIDNAEVGVDNYPHTSFDTWMLDAMVLDFALYYSSDNHVPFDEVAREYVKWGAIKFVLRNLEYLDRCTPHYAAQLIHEWIENVRSIK